MTAIVSTPAQAKRNTFSACTWLTHPKRTRSSRGVWLNKRNTLRSLCLKPSKLAEQRKSSHGRNYLSPLRPSRACRMRWAAATSRGFTRNHGRKAAPPGLKYSRSEIEKLQQFEDAARQEKIGGWGVDAERLNVRAQKPASFSVFVPGKSARPRAAPLANSPASISAMPAPTSSIATTKPSETKRSHAKEMPGLGKIDINTATEKELTTVPGIGHVMAARIIAARPFHSADDLKRVSGIGDKKYMLIRPYFQ